MIGSVLLVALLLAGCSSSTTYTPTAGPTTYPPSEAIQHGDVVVGPGKIINLSDFTRFLNHVTHHQSDKVQITSYTSEGDPIFADLSFDGKIIHYTFDNSRDKFGGQNKGRRTTICTGISTHRSPSGMAYLVDGCENPNIPTQILVIPSQH